MSVNLMELAKGYLGQQTISQISGIVGESAEKTESAIGSALPALIGGFMKKASSGSGAGEVMKAFEGQDDSILDKLGDVLGGNQTGLIDAGVGILKMLFGDGLGSVLDLLTKSTGMGGKSLTSLLGLLAPIVMSILKRQTASGGLDAAGLANMLAGQKEYIAGALPQGFGEVLGLSGLASGASAAAGAVADAGRATASKVSSAAGGMREATNSAASASGSLFGKLLPLIALVALALIAWQVFSGGDDQQPPAEGEATLAVEIDEATPSEELTLSGPLTEGEGTEQE